MTFIVLREKVDLDAAHRVLGSTPMTVMFSTDRPTWRSYSDLIGLATTLNGEIPVKYYLDREQNGIGRFKSCVNVVGYGHLPSYARMQREIRAHLAAKFYWDVDIVNCQPTLMSQVLERHDIAAPLLRKYVDQRQACLDDVVAACGVSRDAAKNLFIRLLYFGRVNSWLHDVNRSADDAIDVHAVRPRDVPSWLYDFEKELMEAGAHLADAEELADVREYCKKRQTANLLDRSSPATCRHKSVRASPRSWTPSSAMAGASADSSTTACTFSRSPTTTSFRMIRSSNGRAPSSARLGIAFG